MIMPRVVFADTSQNGTGFDVIYAGRLTEAQIRGFLELARDKGFWSFPANYTVQPALCQLS